MPVQKYPYKVTKIDWYDYISRGENNIIFTFSIRSQQNDVFSIALGTRFDLIARNVQSGELFLIDNVDVTTIQYHDIQANGLHVVAFTVPTKLKAGTYNIFLKCQLANDTGVSTVPTNTQELELTIKDNLGRFNRNSNFKLDKNNFKFKEDDDENN